MFADTSNVALVMGGCGHLNLSMSVHSKGPASITCSWNRRTSESHLGRRTALTFPLAPPPQKN